MELPKYFSIQYGSKTETGNGSRIFSDDMHISESNMLKPDGIQLTPVKHLDKAVISKQCMIERTSFSWEYGSFLEEEEEESVHHFL